MAQFDAEVFEAPEQSDPIFDDVEIIEMMNEPGLTALPPMLKSWLAAQGRVASWSQFGKENLGTLYGQHIVPLRIRDLPEDVQEEVTNCFVLEGEYIRLSDCVLVSQQEEQLARRRRREQLHHQLASQDDPERLRELMARLTHGSGASPLVSVADPREYFTNK